MLEKARVLPGRDACLGEQPFEQLDGVGLALDRAGAEVLDDLGDRRQRRYDLRQVGRSTPSHVRSSMAPADCGGGASGKTRIKAAASETRSFRSRRFARGSAHRGRPLSATPPRGARPPGRLPVQPRRCRCAGGEAGCRPRPSAARRSAVPSRRRRAGSRSASRRHLRRRLSAARRRRRTDRRRARHARAGGLPACAARGSRCRGR